MTCFLRRGIRHEVIFYFYSLIIVTFFLVFFSKPFISYDFPVFVFFPRSCLRNIFPIMFVFLSHSALLFFPLIIFFTDVHCRSCSFIHPFVVCLSHGGRVWVGGRWGGQGRGVEKPRILIMQNISFW